MKKQKRFSQSWIIGIVVPALLAMMLAACSSAPTYQAPVVSDTSQYATIRGSMVETDWLYADQYTTVCGIDGSVPRGVRYDEPINILAGRHKIRLHFQQSNLYAHANVDIYLEPGQSYIVKSEVLEQEWWENDQVRFWIEDANSGDVVSGRAPGPGSEVIRTPTPPPYIPVK